MLLLIPTFNVKSQSVPCALHSATGFQVSLSTSLPAMAQPAPHRPPSPTGKVEFSFPGSKEVAQGGAVAAPILVQISIGFISFLFQLLTWASIQKCKGQSQHLVSLWWNKNCFECKIRRFSHRISGEPTQYKLGHHLAKRYWSGIIMTSEGQCPFEQAQLFFQVSSCAWLSWCSV